MITGNINKGTWQYRSGTSHARGVNIDGYLAEDDVKQLYAKWKQEWGEPLEFQGGVTAITCELVRDVPLQELASVYGKKMAARLVEAAKHAIL